MPIEGVREQLRPRRLWLRISVDSNGPCGTVSLAREGVRQVDRADLTEIDLADRSGVPSTESTRDRTEWLRLRASVANLGPLANVSKGVSYLARDGVQLVDRAEFTEKYLAGRSGVVSEPARDRTERLLLRPSVARLGPTANVNGRVQ